jgi:Raf kinase inhibitor-like YbhB/YbcL family protein
MPYDFLPRVPALAVTSDDLVDGGRLPLAHVYDQGGLGGGNLSPQLGWSGAPEGTRGYVVTCLDPDAPTGSGFWHWSVVDLPASLSELPTGAGSGKGGLPPAAVQMRNDYGGVGYGGAAPPPGDGDHRYVFGVHAVDVESLNLGPDTPPAAVGFHLFLHTLARGLLVVSYGI